MIFTASEPVIGIPQADYMDIGPGATPWSRPEWKRSRMGIFPLRNGQPSF